MSFTRPLRQSRFLRQVVTLSSGTAIAQAIAIGFLPILTRLYTPEDFGVLTLYMAVTSIFYVFGSFKFEAMILLPRTNRAAAQLVRLVFFISIATAVLTFFIALFSRHEIASLLGNPDVAPWLFFVPVSVFFYANYQALRYWVMRFQKFGLVSQGMIAKTSANFLIATGVRVADPSLPSVGGLVIGAIMADIFSAVWLFFGCWKRDKLFLERARKVRMIAMARRHGPMAATLTISHGMATLTSRLPSFMVSSFFGSATLGFFGLAEKLATAPTLLIANAIGDVYRQRASLLYREKGCFDMLMRKTLLMTFSLAFVPYLIGITYAPEIVSFVFGAQWEEAGHYVSIILVGGFFSFVITPFDKGAIIVGAKTYIFFWHVLRLVGKIAIWVVLYYVGLDIYQILWAIVGLRISLYILDLFVEYKYACGRLKGFRV